MCDDPRSRCVGVSLAAKIQCNEPDDTASRVRRLVKLAKAVPDLRVAMTKCVYLKVRLGACCVEELFVSNTHVAA